jgi:Tol biopolymer transport system component
MADKRPNRARSFTLSTTGTSRPSSVSVVAASAAYRRQFVRNVTDSDTALVDDHAQGNGGAGEMETRVRECDERTESAGARRPRPAHWNDDDRDASDRGRAERHGMPNLMRWRDQRASSKPLRTRSTIALRVVVAAGLLALVALLAAQHASAAFPGKNGRIAFASSRDGNFEIYSMNSNGSGVTRLTNNPGTDTQPAVSPGGNRIAFASNRDGDFDIYVMNADGSEQRQITDNPADDVQPAFAPDGERIAFVSDRGFGDHDIYLVVSAVEHRLLTQDFDPTDPTPPDDDEPASTPTANRIAFESDRQGNDNVRIMPLYPSDGFRLTDDAAFDREPNWSPDGKRIVFTSGRPNEVGLTSPSIFVMSGFGLNQQRLTNRADQRIAQDFEPAFSPNGARIVFVTNRDGNLEIYSMNPNGSEVSRLTNNAATDSDPDWGRPPCTISGTSGDDVLNGTPAADVICGLGGEDRLRGFEGSDEVRGGSGNDIVYGGAGEDCVFGEAGDDIVNTEDTVEGNDVADGGGGSRDSCRTDPGDVTVNCP